MTLLNINRYLLTGSAVLALTSGAAALDATAFADKVNESFAGGGMTIGYDAAAVDGSNVVLTNASISIPGEKPFPAGNITFENVSDEPDGGYLIETVRMEDVNYTDPKEGVTIMVTDITMSDLDIPGSMDSEDPLDSIMWYSGFNTGKISVTAEGTEVFSIASIDVSMDAISTGYQMGMLLDGMNIDLSMVEERQAREAISEMGYEKLTGSISMDGIWDIDEGRLAINEWETDFVDVGALVMELEIYGYTPELVKSLQEMQKSAAMNPDPKKAEEAMGLAMLGLMGQLSFSQAAISFVDAGVTAKSLAIAGKQQGISGEQMAQALKGMAPIALAQLGLPELQQQLAAAISTYLDDPQSMTVIAQPDEPVPFSQIMGAGMSDPRMLVDVLGVEVGANN